MIEFTELLRVFPNAELPHNLQQVVVENQQLSTVYQHEIDKLKLNGYEFPTKEVYYSIDLRSSGYSCEFYKNLL